MNVAIKASLILVGLVSLLSIVTYLTGLHKSFLVGQVVFLFGAIAINIGVVYWALDRTASESTYGRQLLSSATIGAVAGVLIILVSWLLLSVVFPNALEEARQGALEYMQARNTPDAEVQRQLSVLDSATPMSQSIPGGAGAFFTSLVSGAVLAIFKRKKS